MMNALPVAGGRQADGVCIVRTHEQFATLKPAWDELALRQQNPLLTFDWFDCCRQAFDLELCIVTILRDGKIVAIAPLAINASRFERRVIFLDEFMFEYHELLFQDDAALQALCAVLAQQHLPMTLSRMRTESPEHKALAQALEARKAPVLMTSPGSFNWITIGGKAQENDRRLRKRMRASGPFGPVTLEHVAVTPDTVASYRDAFLRVESAGWKGAAGSAIALNPSLTRFWCAFLERAAASGQLEIGIASIGDRIAAMRLLIVYCGRQWEIKIAYDEAYASASAGTLLLLSQLVHGDNSGRLTHLFLGVAEAWQDRYSPVRVGFDTFRVYPPSVWSASAFIRDASPVIVRRLKSLMTPRREKQDGKAPP